MIPTSCPEENELLAVAAGEAISPELGAHVNACAVCRGSLARLRTEVGNLQAVVRQLALPAGTPTTPSQPAGRGLRPHYVGKYLVLDVLGGGGQGEVYRALHPALGKEVVLKLPHRSAGCDPSDTDRLLAEGKVLAELEHPHLARVYDLDFHEGNPFLVMEYVRGRTLSQWAKEQRPTPRQAAALVARVARALAVAHRRGVVHQDLKPQNILVDEAGQPRVIDFGMARLVHAWADERDQPEGGTVAYMSPEQARGESERVGPRSDVFGLGAVLYFLLTGQPPFRGEGRKGALERARNCDLDLLALRAAKVPRQLAAICTRALAAEPAHRHAGAEELAADLERFVRRPRRVAALAACAAVAFALWPAWTAWQGGPQPSTIPAAAAPADLPAGALSLRLLRGKDFRDLKNMNALAAAVPLRTGDELKISVLVPSGLYASLFWIGSDGAIEHLADAGPGELLRYPPGPGEYKAVEGRPGAEGILACWQRSAPIGIRTVRQAWGEAAWPALPAQAVLQLDRDRVEVVQKGRPLGPSRSHSDPEGDVRARLERLRLRLRDQADHLAGVAFAHEDDSSTR